MMKNDYENNALWVETIIKDFINISPENASTDARRVR
jgi:hypothetical protein